MDTHSKTLASAIDQVAERLLSHEESVEEGTPLSRDDQVALMRDLKDAHGLLRTLSHAVRGNDLKRAFGAPGDWGYETPLGHGLRLWLQQPSKEH